MLFPEKLKMGDAVGLIAPASPVSVEELNRGEMFLYNKGYRVVTGNVLRKTAGIEHYIAGEAEERADELNCMFLDKNIKAVICVRGGYGSAQILPYINYEIVRRNPKIFIGYSDITNILCALQKYSKLITFHGPMLCTDMIKHENEYTMNCLLETINMDMEYCFRNPEGEKLEVMVHGAAEGEITGGNFSVIQRLLASPFQVDVKNKILFLEDVNETAQKLDMYLTQMEYAGVFNDVAGIILGSFTNCGNSEKIFKEHLKKYRIPVIYNMSCGHIKNMGTIPIGAGCIMDTMSKSIRFYKE